MKKLPPGEKRITINGNPYIEYIDPETGRTRLKDDYDAKLAKMPPNARIAALKSTKQKWKKISNV